VVARTFLVTGPVHSGKTTFLGQLIELLREAGVPVTGILAPGSFSENQRDHIRIRDIESGESMALAQREENPAWFRFRGYYFNPEAFSFGEKILNKTFTKHESIAILDEVGPMELEGLGWRSVMDSFEKRESGIVVCSVRESALKAVQDLWKIPDYHVFDIRLHSPLYVVRQIEEWVET
jgi:nucleoside-triphosphatase THEP1